MARVNRFIKFCTRYLRTETCVELLKWYVEVSASIYELSTYAWQPVHVHVSWS